MTVAAPVLSMAESIGADADVDRALEAHESIMAAMVELVTRARGLGAGKTCIRPDRESLISSRSA